MKMYYNTMLVMPSSYAVINEDDMVYVEGGVEVYLNRKMLNRTYCKNIAKVYAMSTGLSVNRVAMEIFAHAYLYIIGVTGAVASAISGISCADSAIRYIISHSNPVNLGGDSLLRIAVYQAIWIAAPSPAYL